MSFCFTESSGQCTFAAFSSSSVAVFHHLVCCQALRERIILNFPKHSTNAFEFLNCGVILVLNILKVARISCEESRTLLSLRVKYPEILEAFFSLDWSPVAIAIEIEKHGAFCHFVHLTQFSDFSSKKTDTALEKIDEIKILPKNALSTRWISKECLLPPYFELFNESAVADLMFVKGY